MNVKTCREIYSLKIYIIFKSLKINELSIYPMKLGNSKTKTKESRRKQKINMRTETKYKTCTMERIPQSQKITL